MELGVNYSKFQSFLVSTPWQLEVKDLYVYAVFNWVNVLKIIDEIQTGFINYFEFCYPIVYEQFGFSENKLVNTLKSSWKIFLCICISSAALFHRRYDICVVFEML